MATTTTQKMFNDNYRVEVYQGDLKNLSIGIFDDFYRNEEKDLSDYTVHLKTTAFDVTGVVFGDENNKVLFRLTETQTDIPEGIYHYEIYTVDSDSNRETIVQDILEIINIL